MERGGQGQGHAGRGQSLLLVESGMFSCLIQRRASHYKLNTESHCWSGNLLMAAGLL